MPMIDEGTKEYLDLKFDSFSEKLNSLTNKIDNLSKSSEKDIDRHRNDISDLYDKDRDSKERIRDLETFRDNHEKQHDSYDGNKKFSTEMWVMFGLCMVTVISSGLITAFF